MVLLRKSKNKILPALPHASCHAKTAQDNTPGIKVIDHLINVTEVCKALGKQLPEHLKSLGKAAVSAASLHDVGKVSPGFQLKYFRNVVESHSPEFKTKSLDRFCTDHSHTGACSLWQYLDANAHEIPLMAWVAAIHHGTIRQNPCTTDTGSIHGGEKWSKQRQSLAREMLNQYPPPEPRAYSPWEKDFIAGMVTLSDWMGSDETFFPPDQSYSAEDASRAAQNAITTCGLVKPEILKDLSFEDLFDFPPYETQAAFARAVSGPGVYVLEAPMGMGKTEAALYAAYKLLEKGGANGLFFGLPTRLTSDRIHHRMADFLARISPEGMEPKLAHGTAWLSEYLGGGEDMAPGKSWFSPRKRALLHPFVVGTVDQALMAVLRLKHHFVRTFALAGKVVILDEVHSYDGYTGTFLDTLTRALADLGATVIILSATLTARRRAAFLGKTTPEPIPDYPLISSPTETIATPPPKDSHYQVSFHDLDPEGMARAAIDAARRGQCVLCIANTVAKAQEWHDGVLAAMGEEEFPVGLVHSKFPVFQRSQWEDLWMGRLGKKGDRPRGCILTATQVVEQSVDIDADFLITELAPTDMLLQRMGRQWRHNRPHRPCKVPETWIVLPDLSPAQDTEDLYERMGPANAKVYSPWVLYQTWKVWKDQKTIALPGDIRHLLEATYQEPGPHATDLEKQLFQEFKTMETELRLRGKGGLSTVSLAPEAMDEDQVPTRYSDLPTLQVLLVQSLDDDLGTSARLTLADGTPVHVNQWEFDMASAAHIHLNLLTVATYLIRRHWDKNQCGSFLDRYLFGKCPIMEWDRGSGEVSIQGKKTDFKYSPQKGLYRQINPSASTPTSSYQSDWDDEGLPVFDKARFDW